jgi:hypothetical protein
MLRVWADDDQSLQEVKRVGVLTDRQPSATALSLIVESCCSCASEWTDALTTPQVSVTVRSLPTEWGSREDPVMTTISGSRSTIVVDPVNSVQCDIGLKEDDVGDVFICVIRELWGTCAGGAC